MSPSTAPGRGTPRLPSSGHTRRVVAALALLALAACSSAEAASPLPTAGAAAAPAVPARHPAMAIVDRLDIDPGAATPDVVGASAAVAGRHLAEAGLVPQLVALSEEDVVGAQYPEAGAPLPADGMIVVWLGTPPAPPVPVIPDPAPAEAATPTDTSAATDGSAAQVTLATPAPSSPAPSPPPPPPPTAPAPVAPPSVASGTPPSAGASSDGGPGAGSSRGGPTPPRSNIRTMPPAAPGTVLEGRASWYGPGFAGRTTACGGVFDPNQLTLATRELRCGTRVLVTGPSGASVEATVTDWGPAEWTNRRFDLSAATFAAIHHPGAGIIGVRVEVIAA